MINPSVIAPASPKTFAQVLEEHQIEQLTMFDRIIFKGHLTKLFPAGAFSWFLKTQGILLKDFGRYAQETTDRLKEQVKAMAEQAGRPYLYLHKGKPSKEEMAKEIADRDGLNEGLICVLAALEMGQAFEVRGNRQTKHKEVIRRARKCLHFYFYYLDPEFGWIHIRLQSWFPL